MGFTALLDAPAKPTKRYQIAKLGDFEDGRYGKFSITEDEVASWRKNLELLPDGKALIDFDHKSLRTPRDSRAAGWITGVHRDGEKVMADIDWTPGGAQAIKDGEYQFFSPVFGDFADETGTTHEDTLSAGALTNVPFLGSMPALVLASEQRMDDGLKALEAAASDVGFEEADEQRTRLLEVKALSVTQAYRDKAKANGNALSDGSYPIENTTDLKNAATLAASGHGNVKAAKALIRRRAKELGVNLESLPGFGQKESDSRSPMEVKILQTLGLGEDADDAKVLEAVTALKDKIDAEPSTLKTLDEQAKAEGKVLLDQAALSTLEAGAAAGEHAKNELAAQKFETAFTRALERGKAVPAQKELMHKLYGVDPADTLKQLEEGPQLVNVTPKGQPIEAQADTSVPPGVSPEGFEMDKAVKDRIKELGKDPRSDYVEVWELIQAERNGGL